MQQTTLPLRPPFQRLPTVPNAGQLSQSAHLNVPEQDVGRPRSDIPARPTPTYSQEEHPYVLASSDSLKKMERPDHPPLYSPPRMASQAQVRPDRLKFQKDGSRHTLREARSMSRDKEALAGDSLPEYTRLAPFVFASTGREKDDQLHSAGPPLRPRGPARLLFDSHHITGNGSLFTARGCLNFVILFFVAAMACAIFLAWPLVDILRPDKIASYIPAQTGSMEWDVKTMGGITNRVGLIDRDTPDAAKTRVAPDGKKLRLVFSDEFETPGRTFLPGDDPFFEAVDLYYAATGDQEYYGSDMVRTHNGSLILDVIQVNDTRKNYNQKYRSGMVQSWNKLCFSGGLIEAAITMPGQTGPSDGGVLFWAGFWLQANLVRPGYRASSDGLWPYTYNSCDLGTLKNQTFKGEPASNPAGFSFMPGQRLSACTCPGEDHPGPRLSDGSFAGRGGPEIDIFELSNNVISQSAQVAPFNKEYKFDGAARGAYSINKDTNANTHVNSWFGGHYQQALSAVSAVPNDAFDLQGGKSGKYGVYYSPRSEDGFISWLQGEENWRVNQNALGPDHNTEISERPISEEPMAIVMNVAISQSFGGLNEKLLAQSIPSKMSIDYIRIYQEEGKESITCDPPNAPTTKYIADHLEAYTNFNLTVWGDADLELPKNRLIDQCD